MLYRVNILARVTVDGLDVDEVMMFSPWTVKYLLALQARAADDKFFLELRRAVSASI